MLKIYPGRVANVRPKNKLGEIGNSLKEKCINKVQNDSNNHPLDIKAARFFGVVRLLLLDIQEGIKTGRVAQRLNNYNEMDRVIHPVEIFSGKNQNTVLQLRNLNRDRIHIMSNPKNQEEILVKVEDLVEKNRSEFTINPDGFKMSKFTRSENGTWVESKPSYNLEKYEDRFALSSINLHMANYFKQIVNAGSKL